MEQDLAIKTKEVLVLSAEFLVQPRPRPALNL